MAEHAVALESAIFDHVTPLPLATRRRDTSAFRLCCPSTDLSAPLIAPQCHTNRPPSPADAASVCHLNNRHSNVTRDMHDTSPIRPSLEFHVSPDSHFTVYRIIQDCFRTFLYSPSVLDHRFLHRLACSVHVHNPPRLGPAKQARIQPHFPFLFPFACVYHKHFLRPVRIPQPCHWSRESPLRSAFAFSFVLSYLIQHRTSGSCGAISCHTHTHTHTHSLSLLSLPSLSFVPPPSPRERGPASDPTFP